MPIGWRWVVALACSSAFAVCASGLRVTIVDEVGKPVVDSVIYAIPTGGQKMPAGPSTAVIDQIDKQFVPRTLVIRTGTSVRFPNKDNIRHEVYSFSPPKVFNLKLYSGTPADPVVFDKPGEVTLGCNIHDQMIAYVYIVDTPYFSKSAIDGVGRVVDLPPGNYRVKAVHPWLTGPELQQDLTLKPDETAELRFTMQIHEPPPRQGLDDMQ